MARRIRLALLALPAVALLLGASPRAFLSSPRSPEPTASNEEQLPPIPLPFGNVALEESMMGYRKFVPRLYNWCKDLGMEKGRILPSIGFCSDENQGYPTILILKHFGTYPFNHGYIGGIMALDRHGPHAAHGEDMVIIHAPHVGFDPATKTYGTFRRRQVAPGAPHQVSTCCGKVAGVLAPYRQEYEKALRRIRFDVQGDDVFVSLSNKLLRSPDDPEAEGAALHLDKLISERVQQQSTTQIFKAAPEVAAKVKEVLAFEVASNIEVEKSTLPEGIKNLPGAESRILWRSLKEPSLRSLLTKDMFYFRKPSELEGEENRLERLLLPHMSYIMTSGWEPTLTAALICAQSEFDRSVHSVAAAKAYEGRNLLLLSGINIDISPSQEGEEAFPSTMFLPWGAYVQVKDGRRRVLEQADVVKALVSRSPENKDAIDIEVSIVDLFSRKRKPVTFFDRATGKFREPRVL